MKIETIARYHNHKMIIDYSIDLSSTGNLEFTVFEYNKVSKDLIKSFLKDIVTLDTMLNMKEIICPTLLDNWKIIAKKTWEVEPRLTQSDLEKFPSNYTKLYNSKKEILDL
jgi:hypothetical protein